MLSFIGQFLTLNEVAVIAMFLTFIWMLFRGIPVAMALVGVSLVFVIIAEVFLDPYRSFFRDIIERTTVVSATVDLEVVAQCVGSKRQRTARVFFFDVPHQVGCVTDLRFDFLLAVTVIVVSNQSHHHARIVTARQLERRSVVVKF